MSEQPGRYQRSASGMVGALLVLLLAIGAFVGFRALTREELEVQPEPVDYLAAAAAEQAEGREVAYPPSVPEDWVATSVDAQRAQAWGVGFLTPDGFAGVQQSDDRLSEMLRTYVDEETTPLPAIEPGGSIAAQWQAFEDAEGDTAYAADLDGQTVLVYGSARPADLRTLAGSLTTEPVDD